MEITTIPLGPLQTNCYIISDAGRAVVIDPGGQPPPILAFLLQERLVLTHILITHLHFDHLYGVRSLNYITDAPVFASNKDRAMLKNPYGMGGMWGMPEVEPFTFSSIEPGDLAVLKSNCQVLATPGHTPGSLSFYFPSAEAVFSGDTLFYHSIGRTDFPGGSMDALKKSIETQLFPLPGETRVYSGHGNPTTIGEERISSPMFN